LYVVCVCIKNRRREKRGGAQRLKSVLKTFEKRPLKKQIKKQNT
jgi:hypothetical protein